MQQDAAPSTALNFLAGGGEMGERIRRHDWSGNSLAHLVKPADMGALQALLSRAQ